MRWMTALLLVTSACVARGAENASGTWPSWRGPAGIGSTDSGSYPAKFDAATNVLWKVPLPGKGCSTPIVLNDRIYLTAPIEKRDGLLALDSSGKTLWQATFGVQREGKNKNGSGCNSSPVTDGKSVFAYFKSGTLAAVDMEGRPRWHTNLQERWGQDTLYWDIGTSPVLTEHDVIVAVMHNGNSYIVGFDKLTGDVHWKVSRDYPTPVEGDHSYATPHVVKIDGRETLIVWGAQHVTAHSVADGKTLWEVGGFNPKNKLNWVVVASSLVVNDMIVIPYGRGTELHGVSLAGARVWERPANCSFVPTPAAYKGRVYTLQDRGEIECLDPATGKSLWMGKLPRTNSNYYSSPTLADGKLYAAREDGVVFVAKVDGPFEVLSENDMGERVIASPVPVNNRLLIRGEQHLFCIGAK